MTQNKITAGVDCGKSFLDIAVYQCGEKHRVANNAAGHGDLVAWLKDRAVEFVGMEASGGYERAVRDALSLAGFDVQVFDPGRIRHYARSKGRRAKNDGIDAAVIAEFTALQTATASPVDPAREEAAGLIKARRLLVDKCADLRRAFATAPAAAKAALQTAIDALKAAIKSLEDETDAKIKAQPALSARAAALQTAPGVGQVTARALAVLMPELGSISGRQASALVGVAPFDRDSGQFRGQRHIAGGRSDARRALYMAALVATTRAKGELAAFYAGLRKRGKPAKVALVACMRKLIVRLNAMLAKGKTWEASPV